MPVAGFAAHGTSIRDSLAQLIELSGVKLVDRGGRLQSPAAILRCWLAVTNSGAMPTARVAAKMQRNRSPDGELPAMLTIAYYDPDRDYQTGQARASSGKGGTREVRLDLPAVFGAGEARQLAEDALSRRWRGGDKLKLRLPPSRMAMRPGDILQLEGGSRQWIARAVSIEGLAVAVEAEAAPASILPLPADGGRPVSEPDIGIGRSQLALFELPSMGDAPGDSPMVHIAASNDGQWKALPVALALDGQPLPGLALGRRGMLGNDRERRSNLVRPIILDERSRVDVRLINETQMLLNADWDALMAGGNFALVGDELIQFGRAEQLAPGLFRLSRLLRGRRGTEWAAATHSVGEAFCVIDPADLALRP